MTTARIETETPRFPSAGAAGAAPDRELAGAPRARFSLAEIRAIAAKPPCAAAWSLMTTTRSGFAENHYAASRALLSSSRAR
jgi:hypothetical protein